MSFRFPFCFSYLEYGPSVDSSTGGLFLGGESDDRKLEGRSDRAGVLRSGCGLLPFGGRALPQRVLHCLGGRDAKADEPSGGGGLRGVRLARDGDLADDVLPEGEKEDHVGEYPLDPAGSLELPAGGELLQRAHPRPRHQLYVERARF